jgi:hypothetical protein
VEIVYERVAAIDVGKKEVAVTVRVPGQSRGARTQQTRKFRTFYPVLRQMVSWLIEQGVTQRVIHCSELREYSTILARRVDISDGPLRERIGFADSTSRERTVTCTIPPACTRTRFSMCAR